MKERQDFGRVQMRGSAPKPPPRNPPVGWRLLPPLLAALLILVLTIRVVLPPPRSPEVNIPSFELPPPIVLRGAGEPAGLQVRIARESSFILALHCDARSSFSSYDLSIRNSSGREVWRVQNTKPDAYQFNISVPGTFLKSGKYRVTLWCYYQNQAERVLDSYPLDFGYK